MHHKRSSLVGDDQESISSSITTSSTASSGGGHTVGMFLSSSLQPTNATSMLTNQSIGPTTRVVLPTTSVSITAASSIDTCSNYDEDEMPPIEELGRDYLSRYNSIRRHTIATNEDNEMLGQSNNIMKSTECLLNFGQG